MSCSVKVVRCLRDLIYLIPSSRSAGNLEEDVVMIIILFRICYQESKRFRSRRVRVRATPSSLVPKPRGNCDSNYEQQI
jgi:hypothetical protein